MGTGSFPGVESGRGVALTPHPLLVPRSKKQSRAIPLLSLRTFVAYKKRVKRTYNIASFNSHDLWCFMYHCCKLSTHESVWHSPSYAHTPTRPRARSDKRTCMQGHTRTQHGNCLPQDSIRTKDQHLRIWLVFHIQFPCWLMKYLWMAISTPNSGDCIAKAKITGIKICL